MKDRKGKGKKTQKRKGGRWRRRRMRAFRQLLAHDFSELRIKVRVSP